MAEFSESQRESLASEGKAMPGGGSYPIRNRSDLKNAIQAFGRAKNKAATKAWIIRRARALGATDMLPEGWLKGKSSEKVAASTVYVPGEGEFVELARSPKGKVFRKQILPFGTFAHPNSPGAKLTIDRGMAESLVKNFDAKVCDIVQVPIVDGDNKHSEDPLRNLGEVVGLDIDEDGVNALIDARKPELAKELGRTLIGASAMMHMNYTSTRTGEKVGPTLLHVAVTNRPYITDLKDFEEVLAASGTSEAAAPVLLSRVDGDMRQEEDVAEEVKEVKDDSSPEETADSTDRRGLPELLAELRDGYGIDVEGLQAQADSKELVNALSNVLASVTGRVELSKGTDGGVSITDVAEAVLELSEERLALARKVEALESEAEGLRKARTETEIDELITAGRIVPAQREAMLELRLSNPDMFDRIVPAEPIVSMSAVGVDTFDEPVSETLDAEVSRLAELARANSRGGK